MHFFKFLPFLFLGALMGCDKNKEVLVGEREEVFKDTFSLKTELKRPVHIPASQDVSAWPMAGGNPSHRTPLLSISSQLTEAWRVTVSHGSSQHARLLNGPIIAENKVWVMDTEGEVNALDIKTGRSLWVVNTQPAEGRRQAFGGGLAYADGLVFAATASAEVMALDAQTGQIIWRKEIAAPVRSSPTIAEGRLYVISINNQLDVFDCKTGNLLWTQAGIMENAGILGGSSVAVTGGVVIAPYSSGEVFALRQDNGSVLWSDSLAALKAVDSVSSLAHIKARPVIHKGKTLVISHSGRTSLYDIRTGQLIWVKDIGGIRSPALIDDTVFMVTNEGSLIALDFDSGRLLWAQALPRTRELQEKGERLLWAGPILVNGQLVLAGSNGKLIFCSPQDGKILKVHSIGSPVLLSPVGITNTLILFTEHGEVVAYH